MAQHPNVDDLFKQIGKYDDALLFDDKAKAEAYKKEPKLPVPPNTVLAQGLAIAFSPDKSTIYVQAPVSCGAGQPGDYFIYVGERGAAKTLYSVSTDRLVLTQEESGSSNLSWQNQIPRKFQVYTVNGTL